MRIFLRDGPARVAAVLLLGLAPGLAGCSHVDRAVATSPVPDDFHLRHPVALTNARQTLDIFIVGSSAKLDYRQQRDLEAFAADYRLNGQGRIRALVPRGAVDPQAAETTLDAVRRALAAASVRGE
ncbi:MAG TPA: CpaD family pilus assembly lipoprotein, partial [Lichenihabitans sp.]|nr:CpaD family pilus assembly lipoprotein [Lichenihabitans sp.]